MELLMTETVPPPKSRWLDIYQCPDCGGALAKNPDKWECAGCHAQYPVRAGVPLLNPGVSRSPGFVGVMKRDHDQPDTFIHDAEKRGWEAALRSIQMPGEPDRLIEAVAPNRISWRHVAGLEPSSLVIDIGTGTGGVACQLAAGCSVVAVDRSFIDAAFVAVRASQSGLHSLDSIVADGSRLPISTGVADLVTLIGVLEWVPTDFPDRDPRESQLDALREARRVLKPTGRLYLAIENRAYFGYYLGAPEPHARLRYVSLMDREAADRYSRETRGQPFLELTHSLPEYRSLLAEAGFQRVESYWLYPDYRLTHAVVPVDEAGIARWFTDQHLDPRRHRRPFEQSLYSFFRFSPPDFMAHSVRDYGFVACAASPEQHA